MNYAIIIYVLCMYACQIITIYQSLYNPVQCPLTTSASRQHMCSIVYTPIYRNLVESDVDVCNCACSPTIRGTDNQMSQMKSIHLQTYSFIKLYIHNKKKYILYYVYCVSTQKLRIVSQLLCIIYNVLCSLNTIGYFLGQNNKPNFFCLFD